MRLIPSLVNLSTLPAAETTEVAAADEPDKLYKIVELELRGHDPAVLRSFTKFATTAANHLNVQSKRCLICFITYIKVIYIVFLLL